MLPALPAATLVLLRDTEDGAELLMVERAGSMGFAAGAMVFPGGKVDATDLALAADPALADGFAGLDADDAAARVAAARETFEEAGILTSDGPPVAEALRAAWRLALVAHEIDFAAVLRAAGHRLSAERFVPFARWCPPPRLERMRFDTRFYLARMPAHETACHDGIESLSAIWLTPRAALGRAEDGAARIIFPTRCNLQRLALHATTTALIEAAGEIPVRLVEPWIEDRAGVPSLCIRDDCGYPETAQPVASAMRG